MKQVIPLSEITGTIINKPESTREHCRGACPIPGVRMELKCSGKPSWEKSHLKQQLYKEYRLTKSEGQSAPVKIGKCSVSMRSWHLWKNERVKESCHAISAQWPDFHLLSSEKSKTL